MNDATFVLICILGYLIGVFITYVITFSRACHAVLILNAKPDDELFGVFMFSMMSFVGLIFFLLIRLINISYNYLYNKLTRNE